MTLNQLTRNNSPIKRLTKPNVSRSPRLENCPHKKAVCIKVYTTKPKKPNSAIRRIAKVFIKSTKRYTIAYIPGLGPPGLQQHSVVMLRGGRVPDLPGVKYHLMRNKYDFLTKENFQRKNRRSKFSVKKDKK